MSYATETKRILQQRDQVTDALKNTTDLIDILESCTLVRIASLITVIADAAMTITFYHETTTSASAGDAIDTVVIPDTTAVGKVVFTDVTPHALNAGDQIRITTSDTGTSTAMRHFIVVIPNEEAHDNESDMVESA